MKTSIKHYINIGNKKYDYELRAASKETTHVVCRGAKIDQEFLSEDVPELLSDLPNLILAEKNYKNSQDVVLRFRVSVEDKKQIEKNAAKRGYSSVSSFLRDISLKGI